MGSYRQTFLYNFSTLMTFLTGKAWVHSNDLMTSSCGLILKDVEECTPRSVENALGHMVIFHHVGDLKVFHGNVMIPFSIPFRDLEMVISPLPMDLQMCLGNVTGSFTASVTALLATAQLALFASERLGRGAIETRVRNGVPLAIGKEDSQPDIHTDVRMLTDTWGVLSLWFSLTDDQRIPVPIGPLHEVHRLGCSLYRAMQLDLEEVTEFLWHNEAFLILMQIAILAILPELNGMPAIGLLETREADTRDVILLGSKKPIEGLREAVSKHLDCCGWHMLTLPFECRFKLILVWKCPVLLILRLDGLKHAIVNGARLSQASYKPAGLFLIHEQAVLKCSHKSILMQSIRKVKRVIYAASRRGHSPPNLKLGALWQLYGRKRHSCHPSLRSG